MMPKLQYWLVLLIPAIISCESKKKVNKTQDTISNQFPISPAKPGFASELNGDWVKTEYIESIRTTKSPSRSHNKIDGYSSLIIENAGDQQDSLSVGCSLNNHEGSQFTIYSELKKETRYKTNLVDYENKGSYYLLDYSAKPSDTSIALLHYTKDNKLLKKTNYTRILAKPLSKGSAESGIQYIVNKEIFSGRYRYTDSLGQTVNVTFRPEGIVSGLSGFHTYYIGTDFDGNDASAADLVGFDIYQDNKRYFVFERKGTKIFLYDYKDKDDGINVEKTSLIYTLHSVTN